MKITWDNVPADPLFETNLTLTASQLKKAVYLLSARFIFDGKVRANCFKNLYVVSHKTADRSEKTKVDKSLEYGANDTAIIFAKIDNLLTQLKSSSTSPKAENEIVTKSKGQNKTLKTETLQENSDVNNEISPAQGKVIPLQADNLKNDEIYYRIQIIASKFKLPQLAKSLKMRGFDDTLYENLEGKWYRYSIGKFNTFEEAKDYLKIVKGKGYSDAFVVEYQNGKRVKSYY
jgi:cell division protein FtsN